MRQDRLRSHPLRAAFGTCRQPLPATLRAVPWHRARVAAALLATVILWVAEGGGATAASDLPTGSQSGLPVPRFVSL
ncbi:hypothetical protein, partial [Rhodoplanes serenus]